MGLCNISDKRFLLKIFRSGMNFSLILGLTHYYFVPSLRQTVTDWYNVGTWSRRGTTLGQTYFHRNIMIGQGLDLRHLAHLGQTGGRVWDKLNSFQVCHRFVPYLSLFFSGILIRNRCAKTIFNIFFIFWDMNLQIREVPYELHV